MRGERVQKLVENLDRKLSILTESATSPNDAQVTESFRTICRLEAEELKQESYGVDLLHAIGFVYAQKGKQCLASNQTFLGMGGWLHNVQGKYHVFSETCVFCPLDYSLSKTDTVQCVYAARGDGAQERL